MLRTDEVWLDEVDDDALFDVCEGTGAEHDWYWLGRHWAACEECGRMIYHKGGKEEG